MPINFIPNDPAAGPSAPAMRVQPKRADRPATRSGFTFTGAAPEGTFAPGTPQFLFWQCREGGIAAIEAWEASAGPHTKWQGNRSKLKLLQDAGQDLNAFYDRQSFSFFHQPVSGTTYFSGASTDVVAHELGHGLLDSIRPDFFSVNFLEVAAFHEAFGDCMALLTALQDLDTRKKLLAVTTTLRKKAFVESTAEELSKAIGLAFPGHNAAEPRHAFNTFKYQLPQTLPSNGGPGALINEAHSFGMLFTGCFWDTLANIFGAAATKTPATLLSAAQTAGKILIAGAKGAVITPRFLQSVGRAMVIADQQQNGGANGVHIKKGFLAHNITLGAGALLAPSIDLAGKAPRGKSIDAATKRDLMSRFAKRPGSKLSLAASKELGIPVVTATHTSQVSLSAIKGLKGVVAVAHEPVVIGGSGKTAAIMGVMPNAENTDSEVLAYVKTLVEHNRIAFDGKTGNNGKNGRDGKARGLVAGGADRDKTTHVIRKVGGKKVLERYRFLCGH